MSDTAIHTSAEGARAFLEGEDLPFPPIPPAMAAALSESRPHVFSTRFFEETPYDLGAFVAAAAGPAPVADYALVGVDGHGFNSWALHYFQVEAGLALFMQLPWGGAFMAAEDAREEIVDAFEWASALLETARKAVAAGKIPAGWRLLVVVGAWTRSGFAWTPPKAADPAGVVWTDSSDREDVEDALAKVISGETQLD